MKGRVLVVDDEKNMGLVIQAMLDRAGFEVLCFSEAGEAVEAIESEELDAIVTDLYMPGVGGMEVLEFARRHQPQVPVVMITAFGTVESAVTALKNGAFDFITKPFDQAELLEVIDKACRTRKERLKEPVFRSDSATKPAPSHESPSSASDDLSFLGQSAKSLELRKLVEKVSASDSTVLITGESGTGKEIVAQAIHRSSSRASRPLIRVNCAVIPPSLIESELFGYERGAFSGAVSSKPGRIELAHEGTLFLDEITELPIEIQAKLLRTLRDREFERVGGLSTIRIDTRIIAATGRDLAEAVRERKFNEELYYSLKVVPIALPSLRERVEDIDGLVDRFLAQLNEKLDRKVSRIEPAVRTALRSARWPGNLRQLENTVERMILLADGDALTVGDLPEEMREGGGSSSSGGDASLGFKETVRRKTQETEKTLIEQALDETDGNVTRTAEKLGLSRKGLQLKMKELGIRR